jgi:hypothetical protein
MYYVWCIMTGLYIMSCLCIYVFWHILHPMASFSQKRSIGKVHAIIIIIIIIIIITVVIIIIIIIC